MTRKEKLLLAAAVATMIAMVAILYFASKMIIEGSYADMEDRLVRKDMGAALDAMSNEIDNLNRLTLDWSEWDDTYSFIAGRNDSYVRKNLPDKTFSDLKLAFMIFLDTSGHIVFGKSCLHGNGRLTPIPEELRSQLSSSSPLLAFPPGEKRKSGLLMLPEGPALVSSQSILTTEGKGPRRGTVIFGRLLDSGETSTLARISRTDLRFLPIGSAGIPAEFKTFRKNSPIPPLTIKIKSDGIISGYALIRDIYGRPIVVAHADFPRDMYKSGKRTVAYYTGFIAALILLSSIAALVFFRKFVFLRKERKDAAERLSRLNDCFLGFGAEPEKNQAMLTVLCGEMMRADCALFNRLESGMLHVRAHWNAPPDMGLVDRPQGHLCNDVIRLGGDDLFIVRDLMNSSYADTDPNVRRYGLRTYIGAQVRCRGESVGSLCLVYARDHITTDYDRKFMGILACAMGVEEERRLALDELRRSNEELEARVRERTAELSRTNEELRVDIMERRKAEEDLAWSRSLLNNILDSTPDLLQIIDGNMRILHSNWKGGYDYVPKELRGSKPVCYEAYYPGSAGPCEKCPAREVFKTGKPVFTEKFNPSAGYVEIRAFPLFDESGAVVMVTEHLRNITEQKMMQQEAQKAQKLESLGLLAGGIAHDFNNLLTAILGNISLAKMYLGPEDKASIRLKEALKASERARDLTLQLLTFSRGGAPVRKTAQIRHMVEDSASFVMRGSNVRCDFSLPDGLWPVSVDEGQISRVIQNLVINANQAMPDGGVIFVSAENVTIGSGSALPLEKGNYVRISVLDQGEGIPGEHLPKIFDPYFTTRKTGSGLGLATVYSILKNHNGYVHVESEAGSGAVFHVYLPAAENPPEIQENREKAALPHRLKGRILVMDDEETILDIAAEILKYIGYDVSVCGDGEEAVIFYEKAVESGIPFDAVIMDLTVPGGVGGREAMRRLLEIDPGVKGIVSSGYSSDPILANFRDYGFQGMIAKPYKVEDLRDVLDML